MPESSRRKKDVYTPPPEARSSKPVRVDNPRWLVPTMVALFIIGLAWIVVWYIAPNNPLMGPLYGWNVAIGFTFIIGGFFLSTKWQ
ncbi:MAG: cell division protein CrgA [Candidatus Nanopelagicales bacterium]|nr:cell division protein CrgA [Candidatus Nanopelagicales bacterium]MDZ4248771.1 cell division protein CrgA [Candidatus Nanopelagicales bacterium]MDZ7577131.1 cell division protein CrgA [Candidatus Nanopelagicales bacterium]